MCGIAGVFHFDGRLADVAAVAAMSSAIGHRGPDATGSLVDGPIGFGHARLSIIDVDGGAQPMSTPDGALAITYNGEIFNYLELRDELKTRGHAFETRCDTEVILHAYAEWGEDCVRRLNGQWAFAIWDRRRRRLFLSRDRMGVRPLFYTIVGDSFLFASEVKALFTNPAVPRRLDAAALSQICTFWVTLPPRTPFEGIRQLPPGHSMLVADGRATVHQHWDMDFTPEIHGRRTAEDYADELSALLVDATRIRLRADVPVGAYVSGGLDSSAVAAIASQLTPALETFSVQFSDAEFDERRFQADVARHLGTSGHVLSCTYDDIATAFPAVVWHAETPVVRTAPAPLLLLSGLVRRAGYKVVLTGEGADEMLGGYDIFKEAKVRAFCARRPESRRRPQLLHRLYPYMPDLQRQSSGILEKFFQASPDDVADPFFSHLPRWKMGGRLHRLFSAETRTRLRDYDPLEEMRRSLPDAFAGWSTLARAQYLEAKFLLPGYILSSQGDRMAMANSVEIRMPFLDYRVAEFAGHLPDRFKIHVLDEKHLLKRCMRSRLPESVLARPKQPYRAPGAASLLAPEHGYLDRELSPACIEDHGIFDAQAVGVLTSKVRDRRTAGVADDMAFAVVLSTQLLMDQFARQDRHRGGRAGPVRRRADRAQAPEDAVSADAPVDR